MFGFDVRCFRYFFEIFTISEFNAEFTEEHGGARRKPGEFKFGSGCESLLPILRVLCALRVLCVEFCRDRRIRSSVNTRVETALIERKNEQVAGILKVVEFLGMQVPAAGLYRKILFRSD